MAATSCTVEATLRDTAPDHHGKLDIRIEYSESGINIRPRGYGDATSEPGSGAPIFLELYRGELRLVVWANINSEEPTNVINLEKAREDSRKEFVDAI